MRDFRRIRRRRKTRDLLSAANAVASAVLSAAVGNGTDEPLLRSGLARRESTRSALHSVASASFKYRRTHCGANLAVDTGPCGVDAGPRSLTSLLLPPIWSPASVAKCAFRNLNRKPENTCRYPFAFPSSWRGCRDKSRTSEYGHKRDDEVPNMRQFIAVTAVCWFSICNADVPNTLPLAFGMTRDEAAAALGSPLTYDSGQRANEIYVVDGSANIPGFYSAGKHLVLNFHNGSLTGWKYDWRLRPHFPF
jgi:hypothetical protein